MRGDEGGDQTVAVVNVVSQQTPEDRLRGISRAWAVSINKGIPFFPESDVPAMRVLLDGYTHPDELPSDDDEELG